MPAAESDFPPIVLTFAASDPSGGAGIQADILTLASMGCHPLSVLTAITVQDTLGVEAVLALDAEWVADQARCLLEDMPVDAFKIGVLGSVESIAAIAEILSDYPDVPVILDPVQASGRGDELASDDMAHAVRELLLPQTTILTPNSMEARRLAETDDDDNPSLAACAERLLATGVEYVLITGTHEPTPQVVNTLYGPRRGRAQRQLAAASRQLSRVGLHARLGGGRDARQRPRAARGGARGAGLHLAYAQARLPARHGPVPARPPVLGPRGARGAGRGRRRAAGRRCPRQPLTPRRHMVAPARGNPGAAAGARAVAPDPSPVAASAA